LSAPKAANEPSPHAESRISDPAPGANSGAGFGLVVLAGVFAGAWWATAWVCDDAFITLRTVDNALNGYGLTWNVDERVQAYTHPLWMVALLILGGVLGDPYLASLLLGALGTVATGTLLVFFVARSRASAALALAALFAARAFVDYASSGLENPMSHALVAALFVLCVRPAQGERDQLWRASMGCLLLLTRLDLLFAAAPLMLGAWWRDGLPRPRTLALAALPLVAWELFSWFYYGAWIANSALSKLSAGTPLHDRVAQGGYYLWATVRWDPLGAALLVLGPLLGWRARDPFRVPTVAAVVGAMAWVVWVGGDFMVGRFLTVPMLLSALLVARLPVSPRRGWGLALAVVIGVVAVPYLSPFAPREYGGEWHAAIDDRGVADERRFHQDSTALRAVRAGTGWRSARELEQAKRALEHYRDDPWLDALTSVGVLDERGAWPLAAETPSSGWRPVLVKGGVGVFGFRLGPEAILIDYHGLGDPLLARLPAVPRDPVLARLIPRLAHLDWRAGHYLRRIPSGYVLSRATGENRLRDPDLRELYDTIDQVVSGPLFRFDRFRAIARLNSSWADDRIERYLARLGEGAGESPSSLSGLPGPRGGQ
jgi:arabinofuranosyltransferase